MLIIALVMAVIGLAALVTAVVTSNEVIAWVCIGASVIGVVLLIVDAVRERQRRDTGTAGEADEAAESTEAFDAEYPEEPAAAEAHTEAIQRDEAAETAADDSGEGRRP